MANILEYTLSLNDQITGKLTKIGIENSKQLETWGKVQKQVVSADNTMRKMGVSLGSLRERVAALRAEREWIPANNINAIRRTNIEVKTLEKQIRRLDTVNGGRLKAWFNDLKTSVPIVGMITNPLVALGAAVYKVGNYVKSSQQAWREEAESQTKLAAVMRNVQGAGREQVDTILALTAAEQKLGVIGDEVQLAGAQELATYLTKTDSLKRLIPVMNDMLAQQHGFNAGQEQAVNIALMMGKVIEGQTGALSRYGYRFDEAQEKLLKYGTEAQRVATLAEVITASVGGVNQALAATPDGKLRQYANNMGDLQERVGQLYTQIKAALIPIFETFALSLEGVIVWLETNRESIFAFVQTIAQGVQYAFSIVGSVLGGIINMFSWWFEQLQSGNTIIVAITGAFGALGTAILLNTIRAKAMAIWAGLSTMVTQGWAGAQAKLNLALLASPITWIVAAIIALVAVIGYVIYKTEGWGTVWDGVVGFMKNGFMAFVETIKLAWTTLVNGVMIGLDGIKLGWYKFKSALGIGDAAENRAAIARINADVEARQAAILDGARKVADYTQKAMDAAGSIKLTWNSDKSLSDLTKKLRGDAGIETAAVPGMSTDLQPIGNFGSPGSAMGRRGSSAAEKSSAIATGGQRDTSIVINLKSLVETINFSGSYQDNAAQVQHEVENALMRALSAAYTAQ